MAGHSKWANIQHRKGRQDAVRSKLFSKLSKEITVAAKMGDPDPEKNPRLRLAVKEAKVNSVPKDVIERAIKKSSANDGQDYDEIRYEGYVINGAAIIVDCLTDNKNRAVADVRHAFSKNGGNLGTDGCVSFMFKKCGSIFFAPGSNDELIMDKAIEAGADDVEINEDGSIEVITPPNNFLTIKETFEKENINFEIAELTMKADNSIDLKGSEGEKMQKILDVLDDLDDVQEVYTNAVIES